MKELEKRLVALEEVQKEIVIQIKKINKSLDKKLNDCHLFLCSNTGGKCDKCGKDQLNH